MTAKDSLCGAKDSPCFCLMNKNNKHGKLEREGGESN